MLPGPSRLGSTDLEVFHQSYTSSKVLQPAALSGQSFRGSGELPGEMKPRASPRSQKSAVPGTAVITLAVLYSVIAARSIPSVKGLTASSSASDTLAATAPAYFVEGVPADQPLSLAPPVISSFTLPLACCSLPPSPSLPRSGPFLALLRPFLFSLALTPRSSPNRPPAWPPLRPPAAVSLIKFSVLTSELRQHPSPAFSDYLLSDFEQVFTVGFLPSLVPHLQVTSTNMKSALMRRDVVEQYLAKEVSLGRVFLVPSPPPPSPAR